MRVRSILWLLSLWCAACFVSQGCERSIPDPSPPVTLRAPEPQPVVEVDSDEIVTTSPIVAAAQSQIGRTVTYDPAYVSLTYPGGDVPVDRGVCTDVVVRALRDALKMDLQVRVHEDMKAAFSAYPTIWGLKKPDRNIDHRRVPNLRTYFDRQKYTMAVSDHAADYLPGDLVTCTVGKNLAHIMIVSDRTTAAGVPLVIHNIGRGTQEEDRLFDFTLTGHYRIPDTSIERAPQRQ